MNGKSQSRSHGGTEPNQDVNESNWLVTASKDRSPAKTREGEREREVTAEPMRAIGLARSSEVGMTYRAKIVLRRPIHFLLCPFSILFLSEIRTKKN